MKRYGTWMWVVLVYVGVVLLVFGKALVPPPGQMIFGDDIHRAYYFFRQFFNSWITQGVFPWWNPYLSGGEPFIANPLVNIWYPPNWLFSALPLNIAYSWHLAFHVLWAMVGMFTLSSSLLGSRSKIAAWSSGVIFGLSGFFVARIFAGHVDVIAAAAWMPWVVYAFTQRNIAIAAGVFALQLLAGYQTMAFFTAIAVAAVILQQAFQKKSLKPLIQAGVAGLTGFGLAAFHILPVQEFFRRSIRLFSFPYGWNSYGALTWESLKQLISPFTFGNQHTYAGPPPNFVEHAMFVGVTGLVLAGVGAYVTLKNKGIGMAFAALAFFGLWMSLGPNAPIDLQYLLWKILPMYHYLRIPARHLVLFAFGAAALAGIGLGALHKSLQKIVAAIVVVELILFARSFVELRPVPEVRHDAELIKILSQDPQPYRVLQNFGVWLPQRDALDFDSSMSYGIYSATGYDPSILRNYYEYVAMASGTTGDKAVLNQDVQVPYLTPQAADQLDFLNIKYILVPPSYDPFVGNARYALIREDTQKEYRLYENTTVLPRFYLEEPSCGEAVVTSYTPNRIEVSVTSSCATTLLSSEVFYPGWEARVDSQKTRIDELNGAFRALLIPAGVHRVVFQYYPRIFITGAIISVLTLGILMVFLRASKE
jgi:hypothetical protein